MSNSQKFYLSKRSNGYYYIGYFFNGILHWKSSRTKLKSDALRVFIEFQKTSDVKSVSVSLSQFKTEFLSFAEQIYSPRTIDVYKRSFGLFMGIVGDIPLFSLTPKHIDLYKMNRLQAKSSITSLNIELRTLRAAFNVALRWKLIENNSFSHIKMLGRVEELPVYFNKKDFEKLISIIKERWLKEIVLLTVFTGMRRGEILNLTWKDVNLQRRIISIQSNPTFRTKQGRCRVIPLSDVANHLLQARLHHSDNEYVFSIQGRKISESFLSHRFKKYVGDAGLIQKLHFHSLRHTFASWLVQDGVSLYEVQKLLGHSNISVTQVYSHLEPEKLHSTVNRITTPLN